MLKKGDTIGLIACSNGKAKETQNKVASLILLLKERFQLKAKVAGELYQLDQAGFNGTPQAKATALMSLYLDSEVQEIFDISGGNMANELLPFIDFNLISQQNKPLIGYSDLTVLLNGIYHQTGNSGVNYQLLNLVGADSEQQCNYFYHYFFQHKEENRRLLANAINKIQTKIQGILVGGNIRCLLKLAGTDYLPPVQQKILFLEANSGDLTAIATYLAQLDQIHYLRDCQAILLGQFSQLDQNNQRAELEAIVCQYTQRYQTPIISTLELGHSPDSKALILGKTVCFDSKVNQLYEIEAQNSRLSSAPPVVCGLNHLTFSVSNLEQSIAFYQTIFGAKLIAKGEKFAYFELGQLWLALNQEDLPNREQQNQSYTHIAFSITDADYPVFLVHLQALQVPILADRKRDTKDRKSIYFTDLDGHKFEFHTGNLEQRLSFYRENRLSVELF